MTSAAPAAAGPHQPELAGQTVVVIGGSSGMGLETARREELRKTLPIGRVVGPADVAALAVHIMSNTALDGATFDIDGGAQFVW
jgi:NAD(P)-dependent dehydrogenase (short-subunit alcohol dehydrogenase family)